MVKKVLASSVLFAIFIVSVFIWQLVTGLQNGGKKVDGLSQVKIDENVFLVEIANDPAEMVKGLSGRESLAGNRGMLFLFGAPTIQTFWMKGMNFPLDIIWIKGNTVAGFAKNAPPDNSQAPAIYASPEPVDKVLEINAGLVKKLGINVGDKISVY